MLLAAPAAAALALLAVPLVTTLFQYGAFSEADTLATRSAVVAYSVGLVPLILVKVLAPGFYARQNIRTPVKVAIVSLVATQVTQSGAGRPVAPCRTRARHQPRSLRERGTPLCAAAPARHLQPAVGLVTVRAEARAGGARDERRALVRRGEHRRVASCGRFRARAASSWVVVAGAACYFAVLWAVGFRPSQFSQRGVE